MRLKSALFRELDRIQEKLDRIIQHETLQEMRSLKKQVSDFQNASTNLSFSPNPPESSIGGRITLLDNDDDYDQEQRHMENLKDVISPPKGPLPDNSQVIDDGEIEEDSNVERESKVTDGSKKRGYDVQDVLRLVVEVGILVLLLSMWMRG